MTRYRYLVGLSTILVAAAVDLNDGATLCYKLSYGPRDDKGRFNYNTVIKPITSFPAFHPVVEKKVCQQFNQGDPIPGTRLASEELRKDPMGFDPTTFEQKFNGTKIPRWVAVDDNGQRKRCKGDPGTSDMDCIDRANGYANCNPKAGYMNSGALWYGYHFPQKFSANTGYEEEKIGKFYFISDSDNDGWLVAVFDKANNDGGGAVKFTLEIETEEPAFIAVKDDPSKCAKDSHYTKGNPPNKICKAISGHPSCIDYEHPKDGQSDCFAWEYNQQERVGKGSFDLSWSECCTDGLVFGPIPDVGFKATIQFQDIKNMRGFKVGDYRPQTSTLGFTALTPEDMLLGIQIEGNTCDSFCPEEFGSDCEGCFESPLCGFCNQNRQCMSAKESEKCSWGWLPWVEESERVRQSEKCFMKRPTTTSTSTTTSSTSTTTTSTVTTTTSTTLITNTKTATTSTTTAQITTKPTSTTFTIAPDTVDVDGALRLSCDVNILITCLFIALSIISLM